MLQLIQVPDLTGITQEQAENTITSSGFYLGDIDYEYNDTEPAGNVISQYPFPGQLIPKGSHIDLVVSKGRLLEVPDVVGESREDALAIITSAGFNVGVISELYSFAVPIGKVISQSPPAGQLEAETTQIDVVISLGTIASVITVKKDGTGDYTTIQAGINAAVSGQDTVKVYPGTYFENINFNGKNIILTSTDPDNPELTVINGKKNGSVVTFAGTETADCILRGFKITNGLKKGDGDYRTDDAKGGGIDGNRTKATITHCLVTKNTASDIEIEYRPSGGQEWYIGYGGGIAGCDGEIINCTVSNNTSLNYGGGLYDCQGSISKCTIIGNVSEIASGGGLGYCNGLISNCTIKDNIGNSDGGGLWACHGSINKCTIIGNVSENLYGGGLGRCDGSISNCTIISNTSRMEGGGLYRCNGQISNCTIVGNMSEESGGGMAECQGSISNCIIYENTAESENQLYRGYNGSIPEYSCIQNWAGGGVGNISFDPMFADISPPDPADWDLHLLQGSACIDAGTNTPPGGLPATDFEGNPRPHDGNGDNIPVADIGAYEFQGTSEQAFLSVSQNAFSFSAFEACDNPVAQTLNITNSGAGLLNWSIVDINGMPIQLPGWLTTSKSSGILGPGQSDSILISADVSGLPGGLYSYSFKVLDPLAEHSPQMISVDFEVIGPDIIISKETFLYNYYYKDKNPDDSFLAISNPGGGVLNWQLDLDNKPGWITLQPTSGSLIHNQSQDITISVDITGLTEDEYSYSFDILTPDLDNNTHTITVDLAFGEVSVSVPTRYPTIQAAIDAAQDGDTIIVKPGTYVENIIFSNKNLTLTSIDPQDSSITEGTIIDGNREGIVVSFEGDESGLTKRTLQGFTITNGGGIRGGVTNTTISNCKIINNGGYEGGGVKNCDGTIINCIIAANYATHGGGMYGCDGSIINCTIANNYAAGYEGGPGEPDVYGEGGGLHSCNGLIANCIFWNNIKCYPECLPNHCYNCSSATRINNSSGGYYIGQPRGTNPLFVSNGDYHLKSEYGRWDPAAKQWVYDSVNSPCIDAGDPESDGWKDEPSPNGRRINIGAYGGTAEASKSNPQTDPDRVHQYI